MTSGNLEDSRASMDLINENEYKSFLFTTVGVHPTRCLEIQNQSEDSVKEYLQKMLTLIERNLEKVVAVGEIGLDYDRLQFCPKEVQTR